MSRVAHVNESYGTCERVTSRRECVMSHIWMGHITRGNESRRKYVSRVSVRITHPLTRLKHTYIVRCPAPGGACVTHTVTHTSIFL